MSILQLLGIFPTLFVFHFMVGLICCWVILIFEWARNLLEAPAEEAGEPSRLAGFPHHRQLEIQAAAYNYCSSVCCFIYLYVKDSRWPQILCYSTTDRMWWKWQHWVSPNWVTDALLLWLRPLRAIALLEFSNHLRSQTILIPQNSEETHPGRMERLHRERGVWQIEAADTWAKEAPVAHLSCLWQQL